MAFERGPLARLVLSDGTIFRGTAFGHLDQASGEVVFNTGMTGYQEILTDPSYKGQIVVMTYPLIGNYGVNLEDFESRAPFVEGFVVRELARLHSNFRSSQDLASFMAKHNIVGIEGVDTRAITKRIRVHGAMNGIIAVGDESDEALQERAKALPSMEGQDLVKLVTSAKAGPWQEGMNSEFSPSMPELSDDRRFKVTVFDFGVKFNILRHLTERGCELQVVPASCSAEEVLASKPDGVFLSNGPGDPAAVTYAIDTVRELVGKVPIFGICLGHQILSLALGGKTYKLKFGHHGCNHPVQDVDSGRIEITSQNHGFAVDTDSLKQQGVRLTHINLNDQTVEGLEKADAEAFSVQYHPEAAPGPHDSGYLFDRFVEMMKRSAVSS